MDYLVVPDAHGSWEFVLGLLQQEGITEGGKRVRYDVHVVQLGDLANCVAASINDDINALGIAETGLIDTMLVGNHEHPYFGGIEFSGFWWDPQIRKNVMNLADRGILQPSLEAHGVLLTHAGLHRESAENLNLLSALEADDFLKHEWNVTPKASVFNRIGRRRGGWYPHGGVLWCDWDELEATDFPQIVGHTVGSEVRRKDNLICLDLGAGKHSPEMAGCWIEKGSDPRVVYYRGD